MHILARRTHARTNSHDRNSWSASQVIGRPRVYPRYGDNTGTWAQGNRSGDEWIVVSTPTQWSHVSSHHSASFCTQVEFPVSLYLQEINIYETYNCGGVTKVAAYNETTQSYITVYQGAATHLTASRIFSPRVEVSF